MSGFRRYGIVGAALFAVIAVLLVGGYFLGNHLRPPVGVEQVVLPASPVPTQITAASSAPANASGTVAVGSASPVASSTAESDVTNAYLRYWQVYSDAVLNLDSSHLGEVLDGQALGWVSDEIAGLKKQGKSAKIDVQHRYAVVRMNDTSATLVDDYVSRSVYLDPTTRQPMARTDPPTNVEQSFEFQKISGVWKIVGGTRTVQGSGQ